MSDIRKLIQEEETLSKERAELLDAVAKVNNVKSTRFVIGLYTGYDRNQNMGTVGTEVFHIIPSKLYAIVVSHCELLQTKLVEIRNEIAKADAAIK